MSGRSAILQPLLRVTAIAIATVVVLSILVLSLFYTQSLAKLDDMNDFDLNVLISAHAEGGADGVTKAIATLTAFDYADRPELFVEFISNNQAQNTLVYGLNAMQSQRGVITVDDITFRARAMLLTEDAILIIGRDTAMMWRQMISISAVMLFTALVASILCFVYLHAYQKRQALRIRQIMLATEQIGNGRFDITVPQSGQDDELDLIAKGIGSMAGNIQTRIDEHQKFSDQLAHELRMPLARLSASLHTEDNNNSDTEFVNTRILEVSNTLQDILELSAIRNEKGSKSQLETISISGFIGETWLLFEDIAEDRMLNIALKTIDSNQIELNATLFRRLLVNLIDNALSHTPQEGQITLACDMEKHVIFSVENSGSHFPDELTGQSSIKPFAINKFDGHGKGLAFVYAIADYHGWQVNLSNTETGALVTVLQN